MKEEIWKRNILPYLLSPSQNISPDAQCRTQPQSGFFFSMYREPVSYTHLDVYKRQA